MKIADIFCAIVIYQIVVNDSFRFDFFSSFLGRPFLYIDTHQNYSIISISAEVDCQSLTHIYEQYTYKIGAFTSGTEQSSSAIIIERYDVITNKFDHFSLFFYMQIPRKKYELRRFNNTYHTLINFRMAQKEIFSKLFGFRNNNVLRISFFVSFENIHFFDSDHRSHAFTSEW